MKATSANSVREVKIFTPTREMDFAGHPTIGTAYVLLDEEVVPTGLFSFEENIGAVPIRIEPDGMIWLTTPLIPSVATFGRRTLLSLRLS